MMDVNLIQQAVLGIALATVALQAYLIRLLKSDRANRLESMYDSACRKELEAMRSEYRHNIKVFSEVIGNIRLYMSGDRSVEDELANDIACLEESFGEILRSLDDERRD